MATADDEGAGAAGIADESSEASGEDVGDDASGEDQEQDEDKVADQGGTE